MLREYEIINISVTKSSTDITLHNKEQNYQIIIPVFDSGTTDLIIDALRNNVESQLKVLGKWVIRIHNHKHYKVFCLCFIDPDFGLQYIPSYSPLNMLNYKLSSL